MPLKSLFPTALGPRPKQVKVTSEHVRTKNGWTLQHTYGETTNNLLLAAFGLSRDRTFNLTDLDYYWSYTIPFNQGYSIVSFTCL